jgi:alkanesulfonate monooxygenase
MDKTDKASDPGPRFGLWLPVQGTWGPLGGEPLDSSFARNRQLLQTAEAGGFATALLAQHLSCPYGQEHDQLEPWTAAAGLAAATSTIEIIAAVKPLYFHPAILAKLALGIDDVSQGRFALNLVSGWFLPELERTGLPRLEHDERYAYSAEWISVVRTLLRGERVEHDGEYFHLHDLWLRPRAVRTPRIYIGGESDPGRALAADAADVFLMNGRPLDQTVEMIADVRRRARALSTPLRFGMSAFVISRDTDEEAWEEHARLLAVSADDDLGELLRGVDPRAAMFQLNRDLPVVGTNGGTASGLVGSHETVARRIGEFYEAGVETFMLQFQPIEPELDRFIADVLPRVGSAAGALAR